MALIVGQCVPDVAHHRGLEGKAFQGDGGLELCGILHEPVHCLLGGCIDLRYDSFENLR